MTRKMIFAGALFVVALSSLLLVGRVSSDSAQPASKGPAALLAAQNW